MAILYVGTDDPLDWTRRQVLASAGYGVMDVRDRAQAEALAKDARLVLISNLLSKERRDRIANFLSTRYPDTVRVAIEAQDTSPLHGEVLRHNLDPYEFLKVVGTLLMKQHQHPEVQSKYFLYVDRRRRYISVSDGTCELTGFAREEILGQSIEWLTYEDRGDVPAQFEKYLAEKKMAGSYVLRNKTGRPVPVSFNATVLPDGCMCSEISPE